MKLRTLSCLVILVTSLSPALSAQDGSTWELTSSHIVAAAADLDGGGEMGFSQTSINLGYRQALGRGSGWGLGLEASQHNYDFAGPTALGQQPYWNKVDDYGISASWRRPVGEGGMLFIAPSLTFARAGGADWGDSMRAGGIVSYGRRFSENLTVGFGAGFFTGLEETQAFPVLLVAWQINERWRVGNPFRPGPAGPAGIEVVYTPSRILELGFGGGWRSHRFRLDEDGPNPGGVAEVEGFPGFVRLTWRVTEAFTVDLYGGMLLAGEVTMENASGDEIFSDDLDTTPIWALTLQAVF